MRIDVEKVGVFKDTEVVSYNILNSNGVEVRILNYGGVITDIITPDKNGKLENIVLKYKNIDSYEENPSYFGAIIGRTSGRIADGIVNIDQNEIKFNLNYYPNHGHGGNEGFSKKFYNVNTEIDINRATVELSRVSVDGEEYYPGNFDIKVIYELNEDNELTISYHGKSDKNTLANLTNHSYFNLSGNSKESILDHYLYINSDKIMELNKRSVPTGQVLDIINSEYDFTRYKAIGKDIGGNHAQLKYGNGYDIPWLLKNNDETSLKLYHENTGRVLEVITDRKSIVVYTQNYSDNEEIENVPKDKCRYGVAIEPQNPPIGVGSCFIKDSRLEADEIYYTRTIYKFGISK